MRALDEGEEELLVVKKTEERGYGVRNTSRHPLRRFEAYERALERHGFVITRRT